MSPVGHALVDALAVLGRGVGSKNEEQVTDEEENDNRESGFDRRVPAPGRSVEVKVDETNGDKGVDNGKGIRDEAASVSTGLISIDER